MRERPIILSAESIRAVLAGAKTQTRRVVRFPSGDQGPSNHNPWLAGGTDWQDGDEPLTCPFGRPGDRLWVRESYRVMRPDGSPETQYKADWKPLPYDGWKSPIHMPRWASRLTLEVVNVRVERLQGISEDDAKAEGVAPEGRAHAGISHIVAYRRLWDRLNARRGHSWESNPWVWAIAFRRVES